MDTSEDSGDIVCWAPPVLKNIEAQFAGTVDIGVEHLADEFNTRGLVRILLLEVHHQTEGPIFKRSVGRADDDGIPNDLSVTGLQLAVHLHIPGHDIVGNRRRRDTGRRISLHALKSSGDAVSEVRQIVFQRQP